MAERTKEGKRGEAEWWVHSKYISSRRLYEKVTRGRKYLPRSMTMREKRYHLLPRPRAPLINRHEKATFSKLRGPDVTMMITASGRVEKLIESKD